MTERVWLDNPHPTSLLQSLPGPASDRKLRLFAVACCRRIWQVIGDERSRRAVEVAERYADMLATEEEREAAAEQASAANEAATEGGEDERTAVWAALAAVCPDMQEQARWAAEAAAMAAGAALAAPLTAASDWNGAKAVYVPGVAAEQQAQAALLRDVLGNPFRPVLLSPTWRAPSAIALAQAMYDERLFDRLPVLADALEAAGCTEQAVLGHLRDPGPHVRGCWAVDLLLAKE